MRQNARCKRKFAGALCSPVVNGGRRGPLLSGATTGRGRPAAPAHARLNDSLHGPALHLDGAGLSHAPGHEPQAADDPAFPRTGRFLPELHAPMRPGAGAPQGGPRGHWRSPGAARDPASGAARMRPRRADGSRRSGSWTSVPTIDCGPGRRDSGPEDPYSEAAALTPAPGRRTRGRAGAPPVGPWLPRCSGAHHCL